MDIDKALYMAEFFKMRENIGTTELYSVVSPLYCNLYDDFKPKEQEKQVVEVVKEIKDKTIHLLKKEDQPVFFPDLPELDIPKEDIPEIKKIQVTEGILEGGNMDSTVKRISINKDYIVSNN